MKLLACVRKGMVAVMLATLLSWAAAAQDARTVISNASKAMGADNLKTIQYSGPGSDFSFGQAFKPTPARLIPITRILTA